MATSGHRPGGGIASNKRVEKPVRTGTGSHGTNPGYVSQLGNKVGSHTRQGDTGYRGEEFHNRPSFDPVKFGNDIALNVGKGGPGTGRDPAMRSGSQGVHGPVAGNRAAQGRDILSQFGPESSRAKGE